MKSLITLINRHKALLFSPLWLFVALFAILSMGACKDDSGSPQIKSDKSCRIIKTSSSEDSYSYKDEQLVKFGRQSYVYEAGKLIRIISEFSGHTDTIECRYNSSGRLDNRVSYYEGEIDDSMAFHWNADGSLRDLYEYSFFEGITFQSMAQFFTYTSGKLTKLEYYSNNWGGLSDSILDLSQMNSEDEYEILDVVPSESLNPLYGHWMYDWDLSVPIIDYFTRYNPTKVFYNGNESWEAEVRYSYILNEHNYPIEITENWDPFDDPYTYTIEYQCD